MKKIQLDEINSLSYRVKCDKNCLADYEAQKARARSKKSIARIDEDISRYSKKLAEDESELAKLNAEKAEAEAVTNAEILVVTQPVDDHGCWYGSKRRHKVATMDEAMEYYKEKKDGNGSYVYIWFEVRPIGELEEMQKISKEITKLKARYKELEEGE